MDQKSVRVTANGGLHGVATPEGNDGKRMTVRLDDGRQMSVPTELITRKDDGSYWLAVGETELSRSMAVDPTTGSERTIVPVIAEELHVERRVVSTGVVRLSKLVHEHEQTVEEDLVSEEVEIERVPIGQVIDHTPQVRNEEGILIIPVLEEVLVIEKRIMLKEELRITMKRTTTQQPQKVTLRAEEVVVERVPLNDQLSEERKSHEGQ